MKNFTKVRRHNLSLMRRSVRIAQTHNSRRRLNKKVSRLQILQNRVAALKRNA